MPWVIRNAPYLYSEQYQARCRDDTVSPGSTLPDPAASRRPDRPRGRGGFRPQLYLTVIAVAHCLQSLPWESAAAAASDAAMERGHLLAGAGKTPSGYQTACSAGRSTGEIFGNPGDRENLHNLVVRTHDTIIHRVFSGGDPPRGPFADASVE